MAILPKGNDASINRKRHPFAIRGDGETGFYGIKAGDRIVYLPTGQHGYLDEATHDGGALLSFDDGTFLIARWNSVVGEPLSKRNLTPSS